MRDLGDFQTPPALVAAVLERLGPIGERWPRVLEPTCGRGGFLAGLLALATPPREIFGIEIQAEHLTAARAVAATAAATSVRVGLAAGNLFDVDLRTAPGWTGSGPLLVVGNPPWVTSAALGAIGSGNHPKKRNFQSNSGLAAMTGASNFDLAEAVWIKLLSELADERPTVAMLCKVSVARRVLEHAARVGLPVRDASLIRLDARAWFGASVEACLLRVDLGPSGSAPGLPARIPVYRDLAAIEPATSMGFTRGGLVSDLDAHARSAFADGLCPLVWRQGIKHDAAALMELTPSPAEAEAPGALRNGRDEPVEIEPSYVYPMFKGADLARPGFDPHAPRRAVIVTQEKAGVDTTGLRVSAPRLWAYLERNAGAFAARKSSIYRDGPRFAMFGVGPYSFSRFKVAVSGLHASPTFRALGPVGGRPVMLDDTCYLVAAASAEQAALVAALLNGPEALDLIAALSFPGSKRRVTKAVLQRLDLAALLDRADRAALLDRAEALCLGLAGRPPVWPERLAELLQPRDADPVRALISETPLESTVPLVNP